MLNTIEFEAAGDFALFTDPVIGTGGGRCTLPVPTYEALKGLCCAIYRNTSFEWVVDAVRIMNPIRTEAFSYNARLSGGPKIDCYLRDVRYQVRAHFVSDSRPTARSYNTGEINAIARRSLMRGGRREPFLGKRSCVCELKPCVFGEESSFYDNKTEDYGLMYHGLTYDNHGLPTARIFHCVMENGIIRFPLPTECIQLAAPEKSDEYALV